MVGRNDSWTLSSDTYAHAMAHKYPLSHTYTYKLCKNEGTGIKKLASKEAGEMSQQIQASAARSENLRSTPGPRRWKARTAFYKLSSDLHTTW